jgi:hypothetical protein
VGEELLDRWVPTRDVEGGRLDDRQRGERRPSRREERDDGAVGVRNEVVAGLEQRRDLLRLSLEVDRPERWVRRVSGPGGDDELEALGERLLRVPREPPRRDRPVDQHEPGTRAETLDMHRTIIS